MNKLLVKQPILTEKATSLTAGNTYTFLVEGHANKSEVSKAIAQLYKVKVEAVRIINVKPKKRRLGRTVGTKPGYKKAMITLKAGDTIDIVGA
ncbi:MAG: 50S ribosomal protein L23 [Candidatus Harrisonbacteria bacterium CG10_big_fil_rev_8_21_14_0_10_49_15]|uniref:Large ribosomal subunit protein uL23 n=1 Tax=Candidatus Harrisonbacteria bacterium CG10_big_fil_rev_8_21_14_0_10_49_15 TaxID=1974587 RepID=A0A2H0UKX3_9BACT|nr:MAG: 50S ribosomal protein L23 [Candidatus Harrisonbacteria bacterium CG10_big_fil_rev_8_21_14_0_10_49_15]